MKLKSTLYIALTALTLAACGGGGGGGGDNGLSYSGNTRSATLTSTSARDVSASLLANSGGADVAAAQTRATDTNRSVRDIAKRLALSSKGYTRTNHTTPTAGDCGGNVTVTGDSSGSIAFNNYCVGDPATSAIILNGTIGFSVTYAADGVTLQTFAMSYSGFTVTFLPENEVLAFGGSIVVAYNSSGVESGVTMTMVMQDDTGTMIMFDNYTVTESAGYVTVAGRFCHSIEGCVTVSTPTPLYYGGGDYPTQGVIVIEGANSMARMTASATGYTLEVDSDGNGLYESTQFYSYVT